MTFQAVTTSQNALPNGLLTSVLVPQALSPPLRHYGIIAQVFATHMWLGSRGGVAALTWVREVAVWTQLNPVCCKRVRGGCRDLATKVHVYLAGE